MVHLSSAEAARKAIAEVESLVKQALSAVNDQRPTREEDTVVAQAATAQGLAAVASALLALAEQLPAQPHPPTT